MTCSLAPSRDKPGFMSTRPAHTESTPARWPPCRGTSPLRQLLATGMPGSSAMVAEGVSICSWTPATAPLPGLGSDAAAASPTRAILRPRQEVYSWTVVAPVTVFAVGGGMSV